MYWEDPTNCLFDTGPPTLSPSLILDQGQFYFFWNRGGRLDLDNRVWVHGEVTLTELSVRPAPSALALTTTGVVSLVGARRRRRRL